MLQTSGPCHVSISMARVTFVLLYLSFLSLASYWWSLLAQRQCCLLSVVLSAGCIGRKALTELRMGRCCPVPCLGWANPTQKISLVPEERPEVVL